ncbi:NAD(P)H-binding protein [Fructilactobacillus myrtifloralis]|uniref:NAD(P)H-binding protein n=1 Tax=Fructilactobacillus myrtifloralis TaxID=2940301 RepID=A0ABY5BLF0_9LACO|nr:NAD(P)H-binding protein [Fructilactobacillus myrtifloralis]USS84494.1 NAD(P)H-binding protein [Fructilactobacillus myrtifloralis]
MQKITIIGANGQIAKLVERKLLNDHDLEMKLFARNSSRIPTEIATARNVELVEGDANDFSSVNDAIQGANLVYVNLGGVFAPMVKNIVRAMNQNQVKRLIYVTGLGLYHEVPDPFGSWVEESVGHNVMEDTRTAAAEIESNHEIIYTIIRAAYMSNQPEVDYELTKKGEPFQGTTISRKSIADLIVKIIVDPKKYQNESLGISKPGTDGETPQFV